MLILARRVGESLMLNDEIEIKITEIQGDRVKIGVKAPQNCRIMRKELCQTMEINREAAEKSPASTGALLSLLADLEKKKL